MFQESESSEVSNCCIPEVQDCGIPVVWDYDSPHKSEFQEFRKCLNPDFIYFGSQRIRNSRSWGAVNRNTGIPGVLDPGLQVSENPGISNSGTPEVMNRPTFLLCFSPHANHVVVGLLMRL